MVKLPTWWPWCMQSLLLYLIGLLGGRGACKYPETLLLYLIGLSSAPNNGKAAYLVAVVHAITPTLSNRPTWWPWCMQIPRNNGKALLLYLIGLSSAPNNGKAAYLVAVVHAITPTLSNRPTWWPWCMQIPLNAPTLSNRPELRA